jgi:hypothetical protein
MLPDEGAHRQAMLLPQGRRHAGREDQSRPGVRAVLQRRIVGQAEAGIAGNRW